MTTDCPWCDGPATIDPDLTAVHCDDCQVIVELDADPRRRRLRRPGRRRLTRRRRPARP